MRYCGIAVFSRYHVRYSFPPYAPLTIEKRPKNIELKLKHIWE